MASNKKKPKSTSANKEWLRRAEKTLIDIAAGKGYYEADLDDAIEAVRAAARKVPSAKTINSDRKTVAV